MLLGSPPLIVMDEPSTGIFSDVYENLCRQIDKARDRGTAVLWLSADPTVWADQLLKPTQRVDLTTRAKAKSTALST
jgi:ABC-type Mn2+/Zn2+ transport system ATPase subunit